MLLHCDNFSENAEIPVIFLYQLHHPMPDSHMIYTAPYVMFLMRVDPLRGQVGGGWALEIETFLGPMKWHGAVRRVPFGAQKSRD